MYSVFYFSVVEKRSNMTGIPTSPFDTLPDELVLKIVKMASSSHTSGWARYDHTFVVATVSRVSAKFARIAADKSLWKGNVALSSTGHEDEDVIPRAIELFLGEGVKRLRIIEHREIYDPKLSLSEGQIRTIARKCPGLVYLGCMNHHTPYALSKRRRRDDAYESYFKMMLSRYQLH